MENHIIKQMDQIVNDVMAHFQSDYVKYDYPEIVNATPDKFPFIWSVRDTGTSLLRVGQYQNEFFQFESVRYEYAKGGEPFTPMLEYCNEEHLYLITENEIRKISKAQAKAVIKDYVTPVVVKWKQLFGPLPTSIKVTIQFSKALSFSKLKDLLRNNEDGSLIKAFRQLHSWNRMSKDHVIKVNLVNDNLFRFYEYINGIRGVDGAIEYHGSPKTGYLQNVSYQIDPKYGWHIHT